MKFSGVQHFYLALSFLTRLPVPDIGRVDPSDMGRSALFYPLVGLIIGILLCLPLWLFSSASPFLLAAILTILCAIVTGGLHLDGVADGADAWLGGMGDEERTHRILKDPLIGAAGAIAICSVLLLKFAALVVVLEQQLWGLVLFAPVLGRASVLLLFLTTPYVRRGGLGSSVTAFLPKHLAGLIVLLVVLIALSLSWQGLIAYLIVLYLLRRLMLQRLQGCTGDTAGATIELGEVFWLLGIGLSL